MMIHPCIKTMQKYALSFKPTIKRGTFLCLFFIVDCHDPHREPQVHFVDTYLMTLAVLVVPSV